MGFTFVELLLEGDQSGCRLHLLYRTDPGLHTAYLGGQVVCCPLSGRTGAEEPIEHHMQDSSVPLQLVDGKFARFALFGHKGGGAFRG